MAYARASTGSSLRFATLDSKSFGEWAGAAPYQRAYLVVQRARCRIESNAVGIGDPTFPPFADLLAMFNAQLDEVLKGADEVFDISAQPAFAIADAIVKVKDEMIEPTARALSMALTFYVEPSLQEEVLELIDYSAVDSTRRTLPMIDLFPWSAPGGLDLVLDWGRTQGARYNREPDGLGVQWVQASKELGQTSRLAADIRRWRSNAYERASTLCPLPNAVEELQAVYRTEHFERLVHAAWNAGSAPIWIDDDGLGLLFEAELAARARVVECAAAAASAAQRNVVGYASNASSYNAALNWAVDGYLSAKRDEARARGEQTAQASPAFSESARAALLGRVKRELVSIRERFEHLPIDAAAWDEGLAAHFEQTAYEHAARAAAVDDVRRKSSERRAQLDMPDARRSPASLWAVFANPNGHHAREPTSSLLAHSYLKRTIDLVWKAEVGPTLVENERTLWYPAMPRGVQMTFAGLRAGKVVLATDQEKEGTELTVRSANGCVVANYAAIPKSNLAAVRRGAENMHRVTGEKVVRFLVRTTHQQAVAGANPYNRITIDGGKDALGKLAGIADKDERARLGDILEALQAYRGGHRDLPPALQFWEKKATPGRRSVLSIDVGEALTPGYVHHMINNQGATGPDTQLLPMLPPPSLPRAVNGAELPRLYDLQWEILFEMRSDLNALDDGWVATDLVERARDRANVSLATADVALVHWVTADDAWLRRVPRCRDRITLADDRALGLFRDAKERASAKRATATGRVSARRGR